MRLCRNKYVAAGRLNPFALWSLVGLFLFTSLVHCRAISGDASRARDHELERRQATRTSQSQAGGVRTMLLATMNLPTISPTKTTSKRPTSTSTSASRIRLQEITVSASASSRRLSSSPSPTSTASPSITDSFSSTTLLTATSYSGAAITSPITSVTNTPTSLPTETSKSSAITAEDSEGGSQVVLALGLCLVCLLVIFITLAGCVYKMWRTHQQRHPQVGYITFALSLLHSRPAPSTQPPSDLPSTRRPSLRLTITTPAAYSEKPTNRALPTPDQHYNYQHSTGGLKFPNPAARTSVATRRPSDNFLKRPTSPYAYPERSPVSPLDQQRDRVLSDSSQHITVQMRSSLFAPSPLSPSPARSPGFRKSTEDPDTLIARFGIPNPPKRNKSTKRGSAFSRQSKTSPGIDEKTEFTGGLQRNKSNKSQRSMASDWTDDDSLWRQSTSTLASYYTHHGGRF